MSVVLKWSTADMSSITKQHRYDPFQIMSPVQIFISLPRDSADLTTSNAGCSRTIIK